MPKADLIKIYSQVPPDYYENGIKNNLFQKIWHEREFIGISNLAENNSLSVLDIGCNSGFLTSRISQMLPKASITAIDISRELIDYAKKKYQGKNKRDGKINFIHADAERLPFDSNSFDFILCNEVLDHLVNPVKALSEIERCLKKDGYFILTLASLSKLFNLVWFFWTKFGPGKVWHEAHLHILHQAYLDKLLDQAGMTVYQKRVDLFGMLNILKIKKKKAGNVLTG